EYHTVDDLRKAVITKRERWSLALEDGKLLSAVNQSFVKGSHVSSNGDEIAVFPPVTGG
ncbi:molybdopterin synthase sulfur carrier subunit, partial [Staphylococcus aureus]